MKFKPTPEQERIFKFIKKRPENILIEALAGCGKCLGIDTPILMYNGTIKKVQDVRSGDLLMGDDSKPRTVLKTNKGYGDLYKIIPIKGDSWICNDVHVLTHHHEIKKKLIDVPLNEINYPKYPNGNYRYARLQKTGVDFNENKNIIDSYLLGLWLGDGSKDDGSPVLTINENDEKILSFLNSIKYENITTKIKKYDSNRGCYTVYLTTPQNRYNIKNILRNEFRLCYFNDDIGIPSKYLINSKKNREKLLAGLLDSDGYFNMGYFEIMTKYDKLSDDILYLCRSLGFAAYKKRKKGTIKSLNFVGYYWRINISGSFENIPLLREKNKTEKRKQIKSVLRTGFKTEFIGKGDYYGFTLDGNGRFLLGDFTITHNTSTLVEAVNLLPPEKNIMFLAFNKHIQQELKEKLPDYVRCYTSHGLGMSAIKRKYGDSIKFDEFKADNHIRKKIKQWKIDEEFSGENKHKYLQDLKKMVNLCRMSLTLDKKYIPYLADRHDIALDEKRDIPRVLKLLDAMTQDRKTFDYTDMIYLPAVDNGLWLFPQDYVLVDEMQDLNRCQIRLIEKMLRKDKISKKRIGRLIAIGDGFQSIYGFSSADEKTLQWFKKFPNTKILPLSYSFRCSKKVIEKANEIVPEIKALPDAPEGSVRDGNVLEEADDGDFVLCRTTMPLIKLFFEFLTKKKKAVIKGSDVGLQLIDLIGGHKEIPELINHWENEVEKFRTELMKSGILNPNEHSGFVAMEDKANTLIFLAKVSDTIEDLKHNIETIFTEKLEGIVLSTIHKAKGLEADRVFIIRPDKLPLPNSRSWQYIQEKNLEYVAITRAKLDLIYDHEWTDE